MKAEFVHHRPNEMAVLLSPEHGLEQLVLAAFLKFDNNVLHVYVERGEDGRIKAVELTAGSDK